MINEAYNAVVKAGLLWEVLRSAKLPHTLHLENFEISSLSEREKERFITAALDWDVL
jgi:hypothetical protein